MVASALGGTQENVQDCLVGERKKQYPWHTPIGWAMRPLWLVHSGRIDEPKGDTGTVLARMEEAWTGSLRARRHEMSHKGYIPSAIEELRQMKARGDYLDDLFRSRSMRTNGP